jgi:hypothetical protein
MKKAKAFGYQPLPPRSGSPWDNLERGLGGAAPSGSSNPQSFIGRRASQPANAEAQRRAQRAGAGGKPIAPGQVRGHAAAAAAGRPRPAAPPWATVATRALSPRHHGCLTPLIPPAAYLLPPQPALPNRARDRFVSLPDELQGAPSAAEDAAVGVPTIFEDLVQAGEGDGMRGRITTYCVAEAIDRKALELHLRERDATAPQHSFPDVLYGRYESVKVRRARVCSAAGTWMRTCLPAVAQRVPQQCHGARLREAGRPPPPCLLLAARSPAR